MLLKTVFNYLKNFLNVASMKLARKLEKEHKLAERQIKEQCTRVAWDMK